MVCIVHRIGLRRVCVAQAAGPSYTYAHLDTHSWPWWRSFHRLSKYALWPRKSIAFLSHLLKVHCPTKITLDPIGHCSSLKNDTNICHINTGTFKISKYACWYRIFVLLVLKLVCGSTDCSHGIAVNVLYFPYIPKCILHSNTYNRQMCVICWNIVHNCLIWS